MISFCNFKIKYLLFLFLLFYNSIKLVCKIIKNILYIENKNL